MGINTENITLPTNSNAIKVEPTSNSNGTTPPSAVPPTSSSPTDSVSLSQAAINVARAEINTTTETEKSQPNINNITNNIQNNPELALNAQSNQLTSSTVQSLIG